MDYDFRTTEVLVAENSKIQNLEQQFMDSVVLEDDLAAMGQSLDLRSRSLTLANLFNSASL